MSPGNSAVLDFDSAAGIRCPLSIVPYLIISNGQPLAPITQDSIQPVIKDLTVADQVIPKVALVQNNTVVICIGGVVDGAGG